jgi:hypothetical protein
VPSIQHRAVSDALEATGVHELRDSGLFDAPAFSPAYAWMRVQMPHRLGVQMGDSCPDWGWSRTTGATRVSSRDLASGQALLRLMVPSGALLESDYGPGTRPSAACP